MFVENETKGEAKITADGVTDTTLSTDNLTVKNLSSRPPRETRPRGHKQKKKIEDAERKQKR